MPSHSYMRLKLSLTLPRSCHLNARKCPVGCRPKKLNSPPLTSRTTYTVSRSHFKRRLFTTRANEAKSMAADHHGMTQDVKESKGKTVEDRRVKMEAVDEGLGVLAKGHIASVDADSDIASSGPSSPVVGARTRPETRFATVPTSPSQPLPPRAQNQSELTADQLYQAKILVLDLLGWGVPPEYIIDRGVSHKLIHTVFTDLKLRLPDNIAADYAAIMNS